MAAPSVSVVMATYNGAEFLGDQLASLAAQTRLPLELVVCDDQSSDETLEIVDRFAASVPFEVRAVRNEERLGFAENFLKAARLSRGDLIAWCDQDDVWMPEKLACCVPEFERDQRLFLVVHARQIGDWVRHGRPAVRGAGGEWLGRANRRRVLRRMSHTPASAPLDTSYPGYATVISRRVIDMSDALASRLPGVVAQFTGHDTWTSFLAAAVGNTVLLPDVVVQYRQHTDQATGGAALPQATTIRVKGAVTKTQQTLESQLNGRATRAFFRAAVLTQLAAALDEVAGFERGAAEFRASLERRVASGELRDAELAHNATRRSAMWHRHGEVLRGRVTLRRQRPASLDAASHLARGVARGHYGRPDRGSLSLSSLAVDLLAVANVRSGR